MSKTYLLFQNLTDSLKHGTDLNADATSANTRVTHILEPTILELHTLDSICPSGNLILNINKQNIKRNKTVAL